MHEWNRLKLAVRHIAWAADTPKRAWLDDLLLERGDPRLTWAEEGLLARVAGLLRSDEPWPTYAEIKALRRIEQKLRWDAFARDEA